MELVQLAPTHYLLSKTSAVVAPDDKLTEEAGRVASCPEPKALEELIDAHMDSEGRR